MLTEMFIIAWREFKNNYSKIIPVFFKLTTPAITMLLFTMIFASSTTHIVFNGFRIRYIEYLIPGLMCVLTSSMVHVGHQSILADKQTGITSIIITSGVSMKIYIITRMISNTIFEIIRLSILLGISMFLLKTNYIFGIHNLTMFFLTITLLILFWYATGVLIAIFIKIQILKDLILGFAMMLVPIVSPAYFDITKTPHWLQVASNYNPITFGCRVARNSLFNSNFSLLSADLFVLFALAMMGFLFMLVFSEKLSTLI